MGQLISKYRKPEIVCNGKNRKPVAANFAPPPSETTKLKKRRPEAAREL